MLYVGMLNMQLHLLMVLNNIINRDGYFKKRIKALTGILEFWGEFFYALYVKILNLYIYISSYLERLLIK